MIVWFLTSHCNRGISHLLTLTESHDQFPSHVVDKDLQYQPSFCTSNLKNKRHIDYPARSSSPVGMKNSVLCPNGVPHDVICR